MSPESSPPPIHVRVSRTSQILLGFLLFDALAAAYEAAPGLTPWEPTAGLGFGLLLLLGPRYAPILLAAPLLRLSWRAVPPGGIPGFLLAQLVIAACSALGAWVLRWFLGGRPELRRTRDASFFALVSLCVPLATAAVSTAVASAPRGGSSLGFAGLATDLWLQRAIGILTLAPLGLVLTPWWERRSSSAAHREDRGSPTGRPGLLEALAHTASIVLVLWLNFGLESTVELDLYHLLLLPLLWSALRWGLTGSVLTVAGTNLGAAAAVRMFRFLPGWLAELQVLLMALSLTGLFLGATVAARNRFAEGLRRAMRAAEAANRAKSAFLAKVSHELRTPLNSILGYTELVLDGIDGPINEEQRSSLRRVEKHSLRLLALIDDVLDFVRGEAETPEPVSFSVRAILGRVAEAFGPPAAQKGLTLEEGVSPEIPEEVLGHPDRLSRILERLLENAIQFTATGGIRVEANIVRAENSRKWVRFSVSDTGVGVPEDLRNAIFEAFSQGDDSTTRETGGVGLGLTIASREVGLLGGDIAVENASGGGSVFSFVIPLRIPDPTLE